MLCTLQVCARAVGVTRVWRCASVAHSVCLVGALCPRPLVSVGPEMRAWQVRRVSLAVSPAVGGGAPAGGD